MLIDRNQYDILHGFSIYIQGIEIYGNKERDHSFWAEQFDRAKIPFWLQNKVASFSETRDALGMYLTTFLRRIGVEISW